MPERFRVPLEVWVEVTVNNRDVIDRVTGPEGDDWRADLYPLHTRDDVLEMLADNCARNGVQYANKLDGWADLPADAAVMEVLETRLSILDGVEVVATNDKEGQ